MTERDPDLQSELEELKSRVRALTEAQERCAETAETGPPAAEAVGRPRADAAGALPADFDELVDLLKQEIEDVHPLTALAIFGLGVLVGRLLHQ